MKVGFGLFAVIALAMGLPGQAWSEEYVELLERYASESGEALSAEHGRMLWERSVDGQSCASCHTSDITQPGKLKIFFFTKSIDPMALSASPGRYQDPEKVEKAFDKNCKRVFDRVCTAKEKGDILTYLTNN